MDNLYDYYLKQIYIFSEKYQKKLEEFSHLQTEIVKEICNSFKYTDLPTHIEDIPVSYTHLTLPTKA